MQHSNHARRHGCRPLTRIVGAATSLAELPAASASSNATVFRAPFMLATLLKESHSDRSSPAAAGWRAQRLLHLSRQPAASLGRLLAGWLAGAHANQQQQCG